MIRIVPVTDIYGIILSYEAIEYSDIGDKGLRTHGNFKDYQTAENFVKHYIENIRLYNTQTSS